MSTVLISRLGLAGLVLALSTPSVEAPASPAAGVGSITGVVFDPLGAVIPDTQVQATNELTKRQYTTKTNASGAYRLFGLASGNYSVRFFPPPLGLESETKSSVAVSPSKSTQLDVRLTPMRSEISMSGSPPPRLITPEDELELKRLVGEIAGRVVDRGGGAIPGVEVTAINAAGNVFETSTDNNGDYHLSDLPGGSYCVRLEAKAFHGAKKTRVRVVPSQVSRFDSRLETARASAASRE